MCCYKYKSSYCNSRRFTWLMIRPSAKRSTEINSINYNICNPRTRRYSKSMADTSDSLTGSSTISSTIFQLRWYLASIMSFETSLENFSLIKPQTWIRVTTERKRCQCWWLAWAICMLSSELVLRTYLPSISVSWSLCKALWFALQKYIHKWRKLYSNAQVANIKWRLFCKMREYLNLLFAANVGIRTVMRSFTINASLLISSTSNFKNFPS